MRNKQKQLQLFRLQKQQQQTQFKQALDRIIDKDQSLRIALNYSQTFFSTPCQQSLQQYTPIQISRLIFQPQLTTIQQYFKDLPQGECRVQHFIAIMLKTLNFSIQKVPLYMVGLKDMFFQIVQQNKNSITYPQVNKYMVGELVVLKQQQGQTQFQVRFQQKKKQDYLIHDAGIKKIYFSTDLKITISLDYHSDTVKFYDQDMKNVSKYIAAKDMHGGVRSPVIIDFDYSQMTMRLGIVYSDRTIQSIHLAHYLSKTTKEFESSTLNLLLFPLPQPMRKIYYIQMLNKWLTIPTQQQQLIYLFDMQKVRSKPQQVQQRLPIQTNQLKITLVLQIVRLSTICIVAGNQITFFNQKMNQHTFPKFSHCDSICLFKYDQETNSFYLCGRQKNITIITIQRNRKTFKYATVGFSKIITDFQVFPFLGTLLVSDQTHQMRIVDLSTHVTYQFHSLSHVVKSKNGCLHLSKVSKSQYVVYQTYMLGYILQKTAIQKAVDYIFLPTYYYDPRKQQFYFSINQQILSLSVVLGQVRKNITTDNSNILPHINFFKGQKTDLFIIDTHKTLYQVYLRGEQADGQNRYYKRRVSMGEIVGSFYDQEMRNVMMVGVNGMTQMRNDYSNNFNLINQTSFEAIGSVVMCLFCSKTKYLTLLCNDQMIYQVRNFDIGFKHAFKVRFQAKSNAQQLKIISQIHYCPQYQLLLILNNHNQLIIFQRLNLQNHCKINLKQYIPPKRRNLIFNKFIYHYVRIKNTNYPSVVLYDQTGWAIDINLQKVFSGHFSNTQKQQRTVQGFSQQSQQIKLDYAKRHQIQVKQQTSSKLSPKDVIAIRLHDKAIAIVAKLAVQILVTLTISKQGSIKLWSQTYQCLFQLKIPSMLKLTWNMTQIQQIRNQKSIAQLKQIMAKHYTTTQKKPKLKDILQVSRQLRGSPRRQPKLQQKIILQIQSKQIQQIIMREQDYRKNMGRSVGTRTRYASQLSKTIDLSGVDVHPWRTDKQFLKIYERSPRREGGKNMPRELGRLRNSLDMHERKRKTIDYSGVQSMLPQLRQYKAQKPKSRQKNKKDPSGQQLQTFQSCMYMKSQRRGKPVNELDEIDKQFFRKERLKPRNRYIPGYNPKKIGEVEDSPDRDVSGGEEMPVDAIRGVRAIFQEHNKQVQMNSKGRIIRIPRIQLFNQE